MPKSNAKAQPSASGPSFGVHEVLYIVFKHKWKILFLTLLGLGIAAFLYVKQEPIYKSESKLLVRYVMAKGTVDPFESISSPGGGARGKGDPVINTEMEIINSVDLSLSVAEAMGPDKLIPQAGGNASLNAAAAVVRGGLVVLPGFSSSVLYVSYSNKDPKLSKDVLAHLLDRYFKKHLEIHRSVEEFDLVAQQAEDAKARLKEKEVALDQLRKETGIMSLTDATAALTAQRSKTQEELLAARAQLAEKLASLNELEKDTKSSAQDDAKDLADHPADGKKASGVQAPPPGVVSEYRSIAEMIGFLRKRDMELRIKFKPGNQLLVLSRQQLETQEAKLRELEQKYPGLMDQAASPSTTDPTNPRAKWITEKAGVAALQAKIEVLNAHLKEIGEQFGREYTVGARVEVLQRERDMLDAEYRTLETNLKNARVDRTLDPSRMPNITIFQHPTEPVRTLDEKMQKIILGIAGSGFAVGLALAFIIELLFNRKISRPVEIQTRLQLPLLLSIPYLGGKTRGRFMLPGAADLPLLGGDENLELAVTSGEVPKSSLARSEHFILPYAETLRDRIIFNFEINNVIHKPKFVAVTGLSEGAGASTIAAGLAKSFSEINGSKVLLVDLSSLHPEQNPFFGEMPLLSLNGALELTEKKDFKEAADKLFYASALARRDDTGLTSFTPIQLYELMPRLQASAYDYIVFDMPMVDETSRTLAMAGMMDKVLLVLDAENTSRDALKWGYSELVKGKADVSCIFNKTRTVGPGWLLGEN
jgi:polysaccharide biosynthesis transport protein